MSATQIASAMLKTERKMVQLRKESRPEESALTPVLK